MTERLGAFPARRLYRFESGRGLRLEIPVEVEASAEILNRTAEAEQPTKFSLCGFGA